MSLNKRHMCICLLSLGGFFGGCVESQPLNHAKPFEANELDACLAIIVDQSGSFSDSWDDRAYTLFLELMDKFFTEGMGSNTRVVIGQLSGNENVVLFEGRPEELRTRFRSPDELNKFLREQSDPNSSPVFKATGRAVEYVTSMPGVTENTRLLTVILSDMADSEVDQQARRDTGNEMLAALKRYQQLGGGLALYFVDVSETSRWKRILGMANFEPGAYVIENTLIASPQLPRFD